MLDSVLSKCMRMKDLPSSSFGEFIIQDLIVEFLISVALKVYIKSMFQILKNVMHGKSLNTNNLCF